jgi:hypothetical protein
MKVLFSSSTSIAVIQLYRAGFLYPYFITISGNSTLHPVAFSSQLYFTSVVQLSASFEIDSIPYHPVNITLYVSGIDFDHAK